MSLENIYRDSVELSNKAYTERFEPVPEVLYKEYQRGAESTAKALRFLNKYGWSVEQVVDVPRSGMRCIPLVLIERGKEAFYITKGNQTFIRVFPRTVTARRLVQTDKSMFSIEKFVERLGRLKTI